MQLKMVADLEQGMEGYCGFELEEVGQVVFDIVELKMEKAVGAGQRKPHVE
jgi:hypothetical protein